MSKRRIQIRDLQKQEIEDKIIPEKIKGWKRKKMKVDHLLAFHEEIELFLQDAIILTGQR